MGSRLQHFQAWTDREAVLALRAHAARHQELSLGGHLYAAIMHYLEAQTGGVVSVPQRQVTLRRGKRRLRRRLNEDLLVIVDDMAAVTGGGLVTTAA